jgi:hypothetical protein
MISGDKQPPTKELPCSLVLWGTASNAARARRLCQVIPQVAPWSTFTLLIERMSRQLTLEHANVCDSLR